MIETTNYKLGKPEEHETADIQSMSDNMDILDAEIKKREDEISAVSVGLSEVTTESISHFISENGGNFTNLMSNLKYEQGSLGRNFYRIDKNKTAFIIQLTNSTGSDDNPALIAQATEFNTDDMVIKWKTSYIATMDKVLPLTGGVLSGGLDAQGLNSKSSNSPKIGSVVEGAGNLQIWKSASNINGVIAEYGSAIADTSKDDFDCILLIKAGEILQNSMLNQYRGVIYKIYGEHNITVSQVAPTTTLQNGCMHNVY